jgi:hypothetical protein
VWTGAGGGEVGILNSELEEYCGGCRGKFLIGVSVTYREPRDWENILGKWTNHDLICVRGNVNTSI